MFQTALYVTVAVSCGSLHASAQAVEWRKDVSHAVIPHHAASGFTGTIRYTVSNALLHLRPSRKGTAREVDFYSLELTAKDGTPGAQFDIAVGPRERLDNKILWRRTITDHSDSVLTGKGNSRVGYMPFQGVWLYGKRDASFTMMKVFDKMTMRNFSARLEFGRSRGGKISGLVYFCGELEATMNTPKSALAGEFTATILPPGK